MQIYSPLKFLRFNEKLESIRLEKVTAPIHIRIKPTNMCNHNCWYCAYRNDNLSLGDEMLEVDSIPHDKLEEIVRDAVRMNVRAVTFSGGGEPLLYKKLPEILEQLFNGGIKVGALSNGSNLKGKMAQAFSKYGTWIRISVDAWNNDSYSKSREIKDGAFTSLLDNLSNFSDLNSTCILGISFIVNKDNYQNLFEACSIFKKCGVSHIKISGAIISDDLLKNKAYHKDIKYIVNRQIELSKKQLESARFKIFNHYHDIDKLFLKKYHSCYFINYLVVIGADQNLYTCQDKTYTSKGLIGSLINTNLYDLWNSETTKRFIHSFDPAKNCQHHCVAHAKNLAIEEYLSLNNSHAYFV